MKIIYVIGISALLTANFNSCKNRPAQQMQDAHIEYRDTIHTTRNSVNWDGIYKGVIPCADCEGIDVEITLNLDETYRISYQYMGKNDTPFSSSGKFTWDDNGSIITLDTNGFAPNYFVGENWLAQLDMDKKPISGDVASLYASAYVLRKQ